MGVVYRDPPGDGAESAPVRLHLNRGIGWGLYGTLTAVVFVLVLAGTVTNLSAGRIWSAAVIAVVGLALTAFLAVLTHAMVVPLLTATAAGVSGRTPRNGRVDVGWDEVAIDVDDEAQPGAIRLVIGDESVSINAGSWVGFREFVVLVASTPSAVARLTPAARREVIRLLKLDG